MKYFYDTSAIIENLIDNPHAVSYFGEGDEGVVSLFVVLETYFILLRKGKAKEAEVMLDRLYRLIETPSKQTISRAMQYRLKEQKRGLSYADALGYVYAKENRIPFVTSDRAFKGLPNVIMIC